MKRYMIERDIPNIGDMSDEELRGAAGASNNALSKLAPRVQWQQTFVSRNKTFCVYLAGSEDDIRAHAEESGFPANTITEVPKIIDPTTASQ